MKYIGIHPPSFDVPSDGGPLVEHPNRLWAFDDVLQVDDKDRWRDLAHSGLIEVPDVCAQWGAVVRPPTADDVSHRGDWWRTATLYVGVVGITALAHTPDEADHALVVDTLENWARVDLFVDTVHLRLFLVPDGTPGMTVQQYNATRAPEPEPTEGVSP